MRAIRYLKERFFAARTFHSIEHGNAQLPEFLATIAHQRPHPRWPERRVADLFEEERPRAGHDAVHVGVKAQVYSGVNAFYNNACCSLGKVIGTSGQNTENGRDQIHAQINIGHLAEAAWVGWNQGVDLFARSRESNLVGLRIRGHVHAGQQRSLGQQRPAVHPRAVRGHHRHQPRPIYSFRVRAFNMAGDSASSNILEAMTPAAGPLPSPWLDTDIAGAAAPIGTAATASFDGGNLAVRVASGDLWGNADSFHFVYQAMTGDRTITARIVDMTYTSPTAKAGVMIRETLAADSPNVMVSAMPNGTLQHQARTASGAATGATGARKVAGPYWLRLVRSGGTFSSYASPDGVRWSPVATQAIAMGTQVYVGLALASINAAMLSTATFDNASLQ